MPHISYDSNEPGARGRAIGGVYAGLIATCGTLASAIFYLCSFVPFINGKGSAAKVFISLLIYAVLGIVDLVVFVNNKPTGKDFGKFFSVYLGVLLDLSAIIAMIISIYSLCHKGTGLMMLVISLLSAIIITILAWVLYQKSSGKVLFTKNAQSENDPQMITSKIMTNNQTQSVVLEKPAVIYCHKCGKQLPADSIFCNSCGAKLI